MRYIVTSSLNIDNILSTESVSPMYSYEMRSFGYNKFIQIDELKDYDYILLFSEVPNFEIRDKQRENYPMVIQIDDEQQFANTVKIGDYSGCEVYACAKTIRVNPLNSTILFFSKKAYALSYQNCLDSKMCKLIDYFHFQVVQPSKVRLEEIVKSISKDSYQSVQIVKEDDNQYDRVKGFIYGYYIGTVKSISENTAKMVAVQKRIYDIVASIKSNEGRSNAVLDREIYRLDQEYSSLDPNINRSKKSWKEYAESYGCPLDGLNNLLHNLGLEAEAKRSFCRKHGIILRRTLSEYKTNELGKYCEEITAHLNSIIYQEREIAKQQIDLCSSLDINPDYSLAMMTGVDVKNSLFNKMLNKIIWDDVITNLEELSINRFEIATQVNKIIRQIVEEGGNEWDGSKEQLYFHHLRQNIKEFTSFNLREIDNIVFQSLAAFLLKGEDFDALVNYLETNSISSYQYALALWGATLGYIQIPRTILFSYVNKATFVNLYNDAYKIMHKRTLRGNLVAISYEKPIIEEQDLFCQEANITKIWKAWEKIKKEKGIKNKEKLEENLKSVLKQSGESDNLPLLLEQLDDKVWKRANLPWKKLYELLGLVCYVQKQKKTFKQETKPNNELSLRCLSEFPESALNRIMNNWTYTAQKKGYMTDEHINFFINLCRKEGRGESEHKELKDLFTEDIANKVKRELEKELYANR